MVLCSVEEALLSICRNGKRKETTSQITCYLVILSSFMAPAYVSTL
jgi:hypothetical protein